MGLMDKFKNLFTEEVEVEEEPIKKEMIPVEIPSPVTRRRSQDMEEPALEIKEEIAEKPEPKKEENVFPFFDDEDFNALSKPEPPKESKKKSSYRKEPKEVYKPEPVEKKIFKPTPIISPVYGILDKNYQKEDIKAKPNKPRTYYNTKEATIDEIRNKAYGTLEDEIETTLFGNNHILFGDEPIIDEKEKIEEVELETTESFSNELISDQPRHAEEIEDDLTDLLTEELNKPEENEEKKSNKLSDSELFNVIDSMYQKGDKE